MCPYRALQAYCRQAYPTKKTHGAAAKEAGFYGNLTFELAIGSDVRACLLVFSCSLFYCAVSCITPDGRMIDE
jgi:hypothetical protein